MICTVIREHLQPRVHRPAIKTRYLFCTRIFQEAGKVNQTQFKYVPNPNICKHVVLHDFNVSELKSLPFFISLKIQHSPVIILPRYISNIDSKNIKMNNSGEYQSSPQRKRGKEDTNRNFEFQYQETPHKGLVDNDREEHASPSGGQPDTLEAPPKRMKGTDNFLFMGEMEATTTPSASETDTSTSLDNAVKKDNVFSGFENKAENDTQHNIDHNKDMFYVENEVSIIKNSHQPTDHVSINIENTDSMVSNEQELPAPLNTSDSDSKNNAEQQTETRDKEMKPTDADNSTPETSPSTAEANNQSGTSDPNLERETPDTKNTAAIEMKPTDADHSTPEVSSSTAEADNQSGTSDLNSESQTPDTKNTADVEMKPTDADHSTPEASSSTAEANNQSGTSDLNSESQTPDTEPLMKQPEEDHQPSPEKRQGYCGLRNQGATCYLNSVLQTLFMTEDFREAVMKLNIKKRKDKSVSFQLQKLFRHLKSKTGSGQTNGVTNALDIGNVCEQQDAAEYYQKILSEVKPEPAKIFQGKKKHSTTCKHGNHEPVEEINSFFSLAIAMDSDQYKINVQKSLNTQFEVMLMDGEDQLFCEKCNTLMDMEMKCTIPELPEVLTLHLQRFYLDYSYMIYRKNNRPAEIPLQLSVQEENKGLHKYDLYALVHHTGSLSGGHYYADIKSFKNQQWYQFNDSTVYRIQKKYDVRHITSDTACLVFFRKSPKQQAHEADAQQGKTVMRSNKSERPQKNRTSNPEDPVIPPHQPSDHVSIIIDNTDSTVRNEQEPPAPLNTSDSDTKNTAAPQTETRDIEMKPSDADQSTPETSPSTAEANNQSGTSDLNSERETHDTDPLMKQPEEDHQPSPEKQQDLGITRRTFLEVSHSESPEPSIHRSNTRSKEDYVKSLKEIKYTECKSPQNDRTSIQMLLKPEEYALLSHQCTDGDNQSKPNQTTDIELHETTHNDSDLDNDEAGAQEMRRLQETTANETTVRRKQGRRRKCQPLNSFSIYFIVFVSILILTFIFLLVFQL